MKVSIISKLRNYFITGVLVLIPIGVTVYLTLFFIKIFSKILPQEINPNHYLPYSIPGLEIIISIIVITLIGWLSLSFLGKKLVKLVNDIFKKIPFLRTVYSAIGQMTQSFAQTSKSKKKVLFWLNILEKVHGQLVLLHKKIQEKLQLKQRKI